MDDVTIDDVLPLDYLNSNGFDLPVAPTTDRPLPQRDNVSSTTLRQFCQRAKDLLNLDSTDFVRYVLTGKDTDCSQVCINPIHNHITHEDSLNFIR